MMFAARAALLLLLATPAFGQIPPDGRDPKTGLRVFCDSSIPPKCAPLPRGGTYVEVAGPALPDPKLTPGAIRTNDASEICAKSFRTKKYRKTTQLMKKQVCTNYHITAKCPNAKTMEIDHDLPLELGGQDNMTNLWPQMAPEFHKKDVLENKLHALVCKEHAMTLPAAQSCIISDWAICYRKIFGVAP